MAVARFKEAFQSSPWLKPLLIRFGLSIVLLLYVVSGASVFMGVMGPSTQDVSLQEKLERLRNDTALLIANELAGQETGKAAQAMSRYLMTYERELERSRSRSRSPVDELLLTARDEKGRRNLDSPGATYENSLYFTLSLLTATASGNLLRLPDEVQVLVVIYTLLGGPLAICWLILMGRSMAQLWLLVCIHSCCCGMSPLRKIDSSLARRLLSGSRRRNCSITPGLLPSQIVSRGLRQANSATSFTGSASEVSVIGDLATSERNVLVQPESVNEYLRLIRGDFILPLWTLSLFFLLFGVFGATVAAVTHQVPFTTALFYGYLIFTTIGGVVPNLSLNTAPQTQYLPRFSGEDMFTFIVVQQHRAVKVLWMIYFVLGYIMLAGIVYLTYLMVTWRCGFCRIIENSTENEESPVEQNPPTVLNADEKQVTHVEVISPRCRIGAQGAVLMGSKVIESRRTSAALLVGRQTFIEVETPDLEEGLLTLENVLAEPGGELEDHSESDSGISKTGGSERVEQNDREKTLDTEEYREEQIKAEDDEPNMDDRTTGSTKGVAISPSIEPGRASGGSLASLGSSSNRRGSAISVIHVREFSKTPDSIGSVARDGLLGSAMSEEDIQDELEPDVTRDSLEQISEMAALDELQKDLNAAVTANDDPLNNRDEGLDGTGADEAAAK
ncbi:uncharacterized protein LOC111264331 isoform X1 [Varroa jacobsoni]|uniref:uncharacterized protein LOC111264331 isoform X1 n=1 Tax=Varroa jacobsoni TaxID=62625 RepID=UPI000BF8DD91|nr:uncharacterized protein LOC111264331 isoform X1 [Varroa jacobsoni]